MAKEAITLKQEKFALEFLKCGNQTQAAIEAGYSKKSARQAGTANMKNPSVIALIERLRKEMEDEKIADIREVLQFLTSTMRGEVKDQFELDPALSDRINAAKELLKRDVDDRKMDIELMRLEAQTKDNTPEEKTVDNFMDALNATAGEVWNDE